MNIAIIGAGTMGSGIAQVAATAGCTVKVFDTSQQALAKSKASLEKLLARLVEKEKISSSEKQRIQNNITFENHLKQLSEAQLVIEAIIENPEIKQTVFRELEQYLSDQAIIASNTSSLSITSLAAALQKPERFIGIHFFNPAALMPLVEIIPALQTSEEIKSNTIKIIADWGKLPVVTKDTPGFIVNRVARPFYAEAIRIYEEGIADTASIDWAMKEIGGFKMGPFELMDFIGNDINYTVTETVFKAFYFDPRYKPSFTQKRLFEAGFLGRKSGKGFYNYTDNAVLPKPNTDQTLGQEIFERILVMLINEAADALFLNIASAKDLDLAMTKGVNYPKGLLAWANLKGIDWCVLKMDTLYEHYHEDRYRCSPLLRNMAKEKALFNV